MKNIIFDVETTGFEYGKTFVLSMAAILWDDVMNNYDEKYLLFNWRSMYPLGTKLSSHFEIPEGTQKVHGITEEVLQNSENSYTPIEAFLQFDQWMRQDGEYPDVLVAFNSTFDINMIKSNLLYLVEKPGGESLTDLLHLLDRIDGDFNVPGHPVFFDSMTYDIIFHYEHRGVKQRHNLEDVGLRYGLGKNEKAHDALFDTRRLYQIYRLQREEMKQEGIELDGRFEQRLIKTYNRRQAQFRKTENYLAIGCPALRG